MQSELNCSVASPSVATTVSSTTVPVAASDISALSALSALSDLLRVIAVRPPPRAR
jgi:hypothetical protein